MKIYNIHHHFKVVLQVVFQVKNGERYTHCILKALLPLMLSGPTLASHNSFFHVVKLTLKTKGVLKLVKINSSFNIYSKI